MVHPRSWNRYTSALAMGSSRVDQGLSRFAARYRLAKSFERLQLRGFGADATEGYSSAMKVALAYSAQEALDAALGRKPGRTSINSADLATAFRKPGLVKLREVLGADLDSDKLTGRISKVYSDITCVDVMPIAAGIRHLVFHGDFTAYGTGAAQSKTSRAFLNALAAAVLDAADIDFERHLDHAAIE